LERHEFFDGQIRTMAGASEDHENMALGLSARLWLHLKGKSCRAFKGDMKLRVQGKYKNSSLVFYYPDLMVVCDPTDNHADYKSNPKLVIEVLSSDRGRDLVEKLAIYKEIDSLEEYIVIGQNPERPEVYLFRRRSNFEPEILNSGTFTLESVDLRLDIAELYDF
jgi:Uma2 family endonuclease